MKSIVRIKKTSKQKEKDFYQTNPLMVKSLVTWFENYDISEKLNILDPCSGKGVIVRGLYSHFLKVNYLDKFEGNKKGNFLNHNKKYDIIIMNPPYSNKYKFIDHARDIANTVVCLLPLNISNYNMFHREYEDIPEFLGKIQMAPKMFLDETTDFKAGGNSQYCWYIWNKNNDTDYSKTWYSDLRDYQEVKK
jgi:hypothetical protein